MLTLMVEAHQQIEQLERMPVSRLLELAAGVNAIVIAKNQLVASTP